MTDQKEKANLVKKQPFVPFVNVNKKTIGSGFDPTHLESEYEDIRLKARKQICNLARLLVHSNKKDLFRTWIMLLKLFSVIENSMCSGSYTITLEL